MSFGNVAAERAAIEMTYEGLCTVTEFRNVQNPVTKVTRQETVIALNDEPCALSQTSIVGSNQTQTVNEVAHDGKLFIAPEIIIKPGSLIRIQQHGMNLNFEQTGEPFRYPTHQEILLKRKGQA